MKNRFISKLSSIFIVSNKRCVKFTFCNDMSLTGDKIKMISIGKTIVEFEQNKKFDNTTSRQLILNISKYLTNELGKGFSRSNLFNMRKFYLLYKSVQSVTEQISWTHYCELLSISDDSARDFYEKEAINSNWSVRELKRQISTSFFERLLLSNGDTNKEKVLELSKHGITFNNPKDMLKDPYVLNF